MENATVERLAGIENIIGIKDATGDIARGSDLVARVGDQIDVVSGDDTSAMQHILIGGKGNISVTANLAPAAMSQMCEAALNGDEITAKSINDKLDALNNDLFVEANPIPIKWAMARLGYSGSKLRLPMTELSSEYHELIETAMTQAGIEV